MGELVDSLVRVFEFLIQGILAVSVVGFALVWIHPIKSAFVGYFKAIHKFVLEGRELPNAVVVGILLGMVYFLGVLTNIVGYWVLEPVHHAAIRDVEVSAPTASENLTTSFSPFSSVTLFSERAFLPLKQVVGRVPVEAQVEFYISYLHHEVDWRNCNLPALSHALDPQIKQFRIVRGTILCSLAFCVLALAKSAYFFLVWLLTLFPWRSQSFVDWLYRHTVQPSSVRSPNSTPAAALASAVKDGHLNETQFTREETGKQTRKYALGALTLAVLALLCYLLSLSGWQTVEREYHLMARLGAESGCVPKATQEVRPTNASTGQPASPPAR